MGDVLIWKSAEEIMKILASESAMVAGMSIEEAAAALGYTLTKSGMYVKTVVDTAAIAGSAASAGQAIAGTAATGGAATTAANLTLYTTAEGTTAVGAIGSVALPVAACCLAGAAGYKLGNITGEMIDKAYPDFFTGMFESISEFVTGDKRGLAYIFTSDGEVYMPKMSQDAVKKYIEETMPDSEVFETEYNGTKVSFAQPSAGSYFGGYNTASGFIMYYKLKAIISESPVYLFFMPEYGLLNYYFVSKSPFTVRYQMWGDGVVKNDNCSFQCKNPEIYNGYTSYTAYGGTSSDYGFYQSHPEAFCVPPAKKGLSLNPLVNDILFGTHSSSSGNKIPNGLSKYEVPNKPTIGVPSPYPAWSPVRLPSTLPSKFPTEFPTLDPDGKSDPSTVTPYLPQPAPYPENIPLPTPSPNPNPNPIEVPQPTLEPVPQPAPSPEVDPSAEPSPNPKPNPAPVPTPTPEDTGSTGQPPTPIIPPISSSATGLLHVYNPTAEQVNEFGSWLWTTFSGDIIDTISKLFNNPMDAVIGLHELYCTPSTNSTSTIKAGFLDSGVTSRLVSQRYTEINCGAITVPEYWGNYLDYAPYTKVYCYLPFIGIVELNTDDIMGHGVQIVYKIDTYNGSCIAMIITAKKQDEESVTYQFSGNCAVEVPITSGMKSALQSALIGAATCAIGVAGGAAIAGKAVTSSMLTAGGAKGGMTSGLNGKNSVSHSGSFGSSYGAMGIKKPYIIVKRPVQKVVHGYNKNYGYPAHKMVTIGDCSGYLRCRDFEVISSTATEEEKKRIEILLKEGVYV